MYEILYKYLILNNKVSLPNVGTFIVENIPAKMDFDNKKLIPPTQTISLNSNLVDNELPQLQNFISKELNISSDDALSKITSFIDEIKNQLSVIGSANIPGIGNLFRNNNGDIALSSSNMNQTSDVLPELLIDKSQAANTNFMEVYSDIKPTIIRREGFIERQDVLVARETEDYWWVWAIVLAIMGLGALLYYYI